MLPVFVFLLACLAAEQDRLDASADVTTQVEMLAGKSALLSNKYCQIPFSKYFSFVIYPLLFMFTSARFQRLASQAEGI